MIAQQLWNGGLVWKDTFYPDGAVTVEDISFGAKSAYSPQTTYTLIEHFKAQYAQIKFQYFIFKKKYVIG